MQSGGKDLSKVAQLVSERGPSPPIWQNKSHDILIWFIPSFPQQTGRDPHNVLGIFLCCQGPSSEPDTFSIFKKVSVQ